MATIELPDQYLKAGADYLQSLRRLGLEPDALLWAFDNQTGKFVLVLVTQVLDLKGPLDLSKLLFQAYNAAATPREIDPFVVRLHSPDHTIIRQMSEFALATYVQRADKITSQPAGDRIPVQSLQFGDLTWSPAWIYKFALPKSRNSVELLRKWRRFERSIEHLAA